MQNYKSQETKKLKEKFVRSKESNYKTEPIHQERRLSKEMKEEESKILTDSSVEQDLI